MNAEFVFHSSSTTYIKWENKCYKYKVTTAIYFAPTACLYMTIEISVQTSPAAMTLIQSWTWFLSMAILFWPKERFKILVNRTPWIYGQPVKSARCLWPGQINRVLQYWKFKNLIRTWAINCLERKPSTAILAQIHRWMWMGKLSWLATIFTSQNNKYIDKQISRVGIHKEIFNTHTVQPHGI